jgi:hypothetical protein
MIPSQQKEQDIFSQQSSSVGNQSHSSGREVRPLIILIAVVLVMGVVAVTSFMLISNRAVNISSNIPTGEPIGPIKTPVLVQSQNGGLEASLQRTSGPYFLSELLGAQITITNHSNKSFLLQGFATDINYCDGVFRVTAVGGREPHYNLPAVNGFMSCPFAQTELKAGETLVEQGYMPLTKSGQVTITSGARFLSVGKDTTGHEFITRGNGPLDGHWPVIHILVNAKIPIDRTLSLQEKFLQVEQSPQRHEIQIPLKVVEMGTEILRLRSE